MPLLLPNLDDRNWADLVDEGRALIPVYGPEWTDHNPSDPGITLVELLASIAEMDIYQLNQISDREKKKFLGLIGIVPRPPRAAEAVISFVINGSLPVALPHGLEFSGDDSSGVETRFRTLCPIVLAPGGLEALQCQTSAGFQNLTTPWRRHTAFNPFGVSPLPGGQFYLGLTAALPPGSPTQFYFTFAGGQSSRAERRRLRHEFEAIQHRCLPPVIDGCCAPQEEPGAPPTSPPIPTKHWTPPRYGARTVWEYQALVGGDITWLPLDPSSSQVNDDTRGFTLDGSVTFQLPSAMAAAPLGAISTPLYYLRCRFDAGGYDAAPSLQDVACNAVRAQQAAVSSMSLVIDPSAIIVYSPQGPPQPGDRTALRLELESQHESITKLSFGGGAANDPEFLVLNYQPPAGGRCGALQINGVFLGFGSGLPQQQVTIGNAPVEESSLALYTLEGGTWHQWELWSDFDSSTRQDFHAVPDPTSGLVTFGDGEHGRVVPEILSSASPAVNQSLIFAIDRATRAHAGNLPAGAINQLADSPYNHAVLYDPSPGQDGWKNLQAQLAHITNSLAAAGGNQAETIEAAAGRGDQLIENSGRAVSLSDYEQLALQTPGSRIARVRAIPNLHPSFPCFKALGMITVIVLPYLPQGLPQPTPSLLAAVRGYLQPRRVIGSRVEVVGPTYREVAVQAAVQSKTGSQLAAVEQAIVAALNQFLDPLKGGPDGTGWPFGRDVYRAEIMAVMDRVAGVNYVVSLSLLADGGQAQCGNVCLGPTWLVAVGQHQITVS